MNNDRFKFRVWATSMVTTKMHYLKPENLLKDIEPEDRWVVMQCTGLKDKNGKLIFEGDIVRTNGMVFEIWHEGALYYMIDGGMSMIFEPAEAMDSEVIGNIYENGDLLEDK